MIGLLLARAAPFDSVTQADLRRQQGWGTRAPEPIPEVRSHGRWTATPALTRLTRATAPPLSLLAALALLEQLAPCRSGDAAAALVTAGLVDTPLHPGGVLSLARWYGQPTRLRLEQSHGSTHVVGPVSPATATRLHRLLSAVSRAGHLDLTTTFAGADAGERRALGYAVGRDPRLCRQGDHVVRHDDRGSGLSMLCVRMLVAAPRALSQSELHDGLRRHWRFRQRYIPCTGVLAAWLGAQPWLDIAGDVVALNGPLTDRQAWLAGSAGTAQLTAVVADGSTATWQQLVMALTAAGMRPEAAKIAAHTSPVLVHIGPNAYRLLGA